MRTLLAVAALILTAEVIHRARYARSRRRMYHQLQVILHAGQR